MIRFSVAREADGSFGGAVVRVILLPLWFCLVFIILFLLRVLRRRMGAAVAARRGVSAWQRLSLSWLITHRATLDFRFRQIRELCSRRGLRYTRRLHQTGSVCREGRRSSRCQRVQLGLVVALPNVFPRWLGWSRNLRLTSLVFRFIRIIRRCGSEGRPLVITQCLLLTTLGMNGIRCRGNTCRRW